jgi:hypothetical protein
MLIGPRLARVSPSFSLIGAALPIVSEVFSIIHRSVCALKFTGHAAALTVSPACYPCRDLGSVV